MNADQVAVILPARNEEGAVAGVVDSFRAMGVRVVVVDNASTDDTATLASNAGAEVLFEPRVGYGVACLRGIQHLRRTPPQIIAFADCDGTIDAADLKAVVEPLQSAAADLVLGRRTRIEPGAYPWHQQMGNRVILAILNRLTKASVRDIPPLRAVRADVLFELDLRDMTYGLPVETVAAASGRGFRIREVDVSYRRRRSGKSKVSGSILRSAAAGGVMVKTLVGAWRRSRRRTGTIVVFGRAPELGRVKTRLERSYTRPFVLALYRAMLSDTLRAARLAGARVVLSHTKAPPFEEQGQADILIEQRGETFEERFDDTLARARRAAPAGPLMIVGADTPHLRPGMMRAALLDAMHGSAVIGPATRGGFYALAFPHDPVPVRGAFSAADQVGALRTVVETSGIPTTTMADLFDIDEPRDLERLAQSQPSADWFWSSTRAILSGPDFPPATVPRPPPAPGATLPRPLAQGGHVHTPAPRARSNR
ncbi:MAG: DUF2064 domain-containing protein [Euryarchaeota archaeon]|nr:DUF2064 domain-containing protein [Euryarchaeota archaeon]